MSATKIPQPRFGQFMGQTVVNLTFHDGSWLEGEEFCYPKGGWTRRAYATCPDGVMRHVRCTLADTYFSIPARLPGGQRGYLSVIGHDHNQRLIFTPDKDQNPS